MPIMLQPCHILPAALVGWANVLKAHGIEPAPDRQRPQSWSTFLKAHWDSIHATDFTTVEVWTRHGLVTFYVLAVMHLETQRVHIAGITPSPNAVWMRQVCRNLTDCEGGFLKNASHLIVVVLLGVQWLRHVVEKLFKLLIRRGHRGRQQDLLAALLDLQLRDEPEVENRHVEMCERQCQFDS